VTGCYAQLQPEEVASIDGVGAVIGTREKFRIFDHVDPLKRDHHPRIFVSDPWSDPDFGTAFSTTADDRTRAFLKIQDGCDYNCSFCTIPLARGPSRSQPQEEVLRQARNLISDGYREIVLTGVNVGDYGKEEQGNLLSLLKSLDRLEGLDRIRISSIEPNLVSDEMIDFIAGAKTVCPHIHIPLQSGDDEVLRLMRRRYNTGQYAHLVREIRRRMPDCGIGVDVIVGFPGETGHHFERTCRFIEDLPVSYLHVFTYSERVNTPAAGYAGRIRPEVRFARNRTLRMLGAKKKRAFNEGMTGRILPVLVEDDVENDYRFGLTREYVRVAIPADSAEPNSVVPVRILGVRGETCVGHPQIAAA
jgi:threonylcarbamoyladenosine tRNA methylthiotransferase MtaB